jgi:hypothetical protein
MIGSHSFLSRHREEVRAMRLSQSSVQLVSLGFALVILSVALLALMTFASNF